MTIKHTLKHLKNTCIDMYFFCKKSGTLCHQWLKDDTFCKVYFKTKIDALRRYNHKNNELLLLYRIIILMSCAFDWVFFLFLEYINMCIYILLLKFFC